MKFEIIKNNKKILLAMVVLLLVGLSLILSVSYAKYEVKDSINIVKGNINFKPYDLNLVAVYQETDTGSYDFIENIPGSGYYLDEEKSYCEVNGIKDSTIKIDYTGSKIEISDISKKGTRCYAYFNKTESKSCPNGATSCEAIMANINTVAVRKDFSKNVSTSSTGVIYQAEDDDGMSYYFAGNPTDNYIKFGGYLWRIVRINGDGTIRIISAGDFMNPTKGIIPNTVFNNYHGNNAYAGYMYTIGEQHGLGTSSNIKTALESWYGTNLASYASFIDTNAGFCGDREINSGTGLGDDVTYYMFTKRLADKSPSFKCSNNLDNYTVLGASKGNNALTYPIGLITLDEVYYAGGLFVYSNFNSVNYLSFDNVYWTMTPYFREINIYVGFVEPSGNVRATHAADPTVPVARPVINLRADLTFTGNGQARNPYVIAQ